MKLLTGLFRSCRKKLSLTHDNDMGAFREKLDALVEQKDTLSDEDVAGKVEELKAVCNDLPDDDKKAELLRFLEDFKNVKGQDANVAKEAAKQVADLFEELDTSAMQDTPSAPADSNEEVEKVAEETLPPEGEPAAEEEVVAEKETKDDDPNPEYTMEEIYQFIKRRMAEDEDEDEPAAQDEDGTEKEEDEVVVEDDENKDDEKEDDKECTTDHAPRIAVQFGKGNTVKGGLADLFNSVKGV